MAFWWKLIWLLLFSLFYLCLKLLWGSCFKMSLFIVETDLRLVFWHFDFCVRNLFWVGDVKFLYIQFCVWNWFKVGDIKFLYFYICAWNRYGVGVIKFLFSYVCFWNWLKVGDIKFLYFFTCVWNWYGVGGAETVNLRNATLTWSPECFRRKPSHDWNL